MSDDYTPTTDEVVEALKYGSYRRVGYGEMRMGREEFFRWLEREREAAALNARIEERDFLRSQMPAHDAEVRARVLAEQGEPKGENVFIQRYGMFHASFGGIGGDAIRLEITREAWKAIGEPRALNVLWFPVEDEKDTDTLPEVRTTNKETP